MEETPNKKKINPGKNSNKNTNTNSNINQRRQTISISQSKPSKEFLQKQTMRSNRSKGEKVTLEDVTILLKKSNRSFKINYLIEQYLLSVTSYLSFRFNKDQLQYHIHMKNLSETLMHQNKPRHSILFKFGDYGEKYYIILNGKVDVLIPKWKNEKLSKKQYFVMLSKFKIYGENQLLSEILERNKDILPISMEDLDEFIEYEIYLEKGRKEKITQISEVKNLLALNPNAIKRNSMYLSTKSFIENEENNFNEKTLILNNFAKDNNNNNTFKEKNFSLRCIREFNGINSTKSIPAIDRKSEKDVIEENSDDKDSEFSNKENNESFIENIKEFNSVKNKNKNIILHKFLNPNAEKEKSVISFLQKYSTEKNLKNSPKSSTKEIRSNLKIDKSLEILSKSDKVKFNTEKKSTTKRLNTIKEEKAPIIPSKKISNRLTNQIKEKELSNSKPMKFFESFVAKFIEPTTSSIVNELNRIGISTKSPENTQKIKNLKPHSVNFLNFKQKKIESKEEKPEEKIKKNEKSRKNRKNNSMSTKKLNKIHNLLIQAEKEKQSLENSNYFEVELERNKKEHKIQISKINSNNFLQNFNFEDLDLNKKSSNSIIEEEKKNKKKRSTSFISKNNFLAKFFLEKKPKNEKKIEKEISNNSTESKRFESSFISSGSGSNEDSDSEKSESIPCKEVNRKKFLERKFKFAKKERNCNFFDKYYYEKELNNSLINEISSKGYMERLDLCLIKNPSSEVKKFEFFIVKYEIVNNLKSGDIFGEQAFKERNQKRTATIITNEETDFGYSNRENYYNILSEEKTNLIYSEIMNLLQHIIFRNYTRITFYKEIYPTLIREYYIRYDNIFKENDTYNNVLLLSEGEYCLKVRKSFTEINSLIKKLGGIPEGEEEEIIKMHDNEEFKKYMENKQELKIYFINKQDIISEDYILDGKYIFDLQCISPHAKLFTMENSKFDSIRQKNKFIKEQMSQLKFERQRNLVIRLNDIKKSKKSIFKRNIKHQSDILNKISNIISPNVQIKDNLNKQYFSQSDYDIVEQKTIDAKKPPNEIIKCPKRKIVRNNNNDKEIRFIVKDIIDNKEKNLNEKVFYSSERKINVNKDAKDILNIYNKNTGMTSSYSEINKKLSLNNMVLFNKTYKRNNNYNFTKDKLNFSSNNISILETKNLNTQKVEEKEKIKNNSSTPKIVNKNNFLMEKNININTQKSMDTIKSYYQINSIGFYETKKFPTEKKENNFDNKKIKEKEIDKEVILFRKKFEKENQKKNSNTNSILIDSKGEIKIRYSKHNSNLRPKDLDFEKMVIKNSVKINSRNFSKVKKLKNPERFNHKKNSFRNSECFSSECKSQSGKINLAATPIKIFHFDKEKEKKYFSSKKENFTKKFQGIKREYQFDSFKNNLDFSKEEINDLEYYGEFCGLVKEKNLPILNNESTTNKLRNSIGVNVNRNDFSGKIIKKYSIGDKKGFNGNGNEIVI